MTAPPPADQHNRTWLVSVLFTDIVGYSKQAVEVQLAQKSVLNRGIAEALAGMPVDDRIILDTGDGAAVCFLTDPEAALLSALTVHRVLYEASQQSDGSVLVRMGINLGPVKLVRDLNGALNAVGDGINVGQRIMSFAEDGHITASRSFVEVVACLSAEYERRFELLGPKKDKHSREHIVYRVKCDSEAVVMRSAEPIAVIGPGEILPEFVEAVRRELTLVLGPIAAVLTRRIVKSAKDGADFVQRCAAEVEDAADRERFLGKVKCIPVRSTGASSAVACVGEAAAAPYCPIALDGTTIGDIERALCSYVGPVGKVLVKKALPSVRSAPELFHALAEHIQEEADKASFLAQCTGG